MVVAAFVLGATSVVPAGAREPLVSTVDPRVNDSGFGWSSAVDADTAVVGVFQDNTPAGIHAGSAYVYVRTGSTWRPQAKLAPSDASASQRFGWSVAVDGDTAVVGTIDDQSYTGAAYVFTRSAGMWTQQAKLVGPDSDGDDEFGASVSIDGDAVLVGASMDESAQGEPQAGSAYVFVRSGESWSFQAKLAAPDAARYDGFGGSVALDGDTAVAGAVGDTLSIGRTGSAYVFSRSGDTWMFQSKLLPPDPGPGEVDSGFGDSVDVSGGIALVGMGEDDGAIGEFDLGAAYVFARSGTTWRRVARLTAPDGQQYDMFGNAVSLDGDTAVVAAYAHETGALYVYLRQGTQWMIQAELQSPNPDRAEEIGFSVALDGDTVVSGAINDTTPAGVQSGSAYVFARTGSAWAMEAKLIAPDLAAGDAFGLAVALDGDTVAVGAPWDNLGGRFDAGSAYAFVRTEGTWNLQDRLVAPDAGKGDHFGRAVAVSADTMVVGAPGADGPGGPEAGEAYVFSRSGTEWRWETTLTATDPAAGDGFGNSVAMDGDTAVVGAYRDDAQGTNSGSVFVFVRSGTVWTFQAELGSPDPHPFDQFGSSVAIDSDSALVGSTRSDPLAVTDAGAAYVFVRTGTEWAPQAQLAASSPATGDAFGGSVALRADTALVGANYRDTPSGEDAGAGFVFGRSGASWTLQAELEAPDGVAGDGFGWGVGLDADTAIVGAGAADTDSGLDAGAAYVFVRSGTAWTLQARLEAPDGAELDGFGRSVALEGDTAVAGAYSHDLPIGTNAGSGYAFIRIGMDWGLEATLTPRL